MDGRSEGFVALSSWLRPKQRRKEHSAVVYMLPLPRPTRAQAPPVKPAVVAAKRTPAKSNSRLGRRRSVRVTLRMPVVVHEAAADVRQPLERTHTLSVSRYGGLISLTATVNWGQSLLLTNPFSRVSQECRVVYVGREQKDKRQVGVEFMGTVSNFWNISFPCGAASEPLTP